MGQDEVHQEGAVKTGDLIEFVPDETGWLPMFFQRADSTVMLGGETVPHRWGLVYASRERRMKLTFMGRQYVCVLVGDCIGYVMEKYVRRVKCKSAERRDIHRA